MDFAEKTLEDGPANRVAALRFLGRPSILRVQMYKRGQAFGAIRGWRLPGIEVGGLPRILPRAERLSREPG